MDVRHRVSGMTGTLVAVYELEDISSQIRH